MITLEQLDKELTELWVQANHLLHNGEVPCPDELRNACNNMAQATRDIQRAGKNKKLEDPRWTTT